MSLLISEIAKLENLQAAVLRVKSKFPLLRDRAWFDNDLEGKLGQLKEELEEGTFAPRNTIYYYSMLDKKLLCAQFDAQGWVAHEAIVWVFSGWLTDIAVANTSNSVAGAETLMRASKRWKQEQPWVTGCDVQRFFSSIQHPILLSQLSVLISCKTTLQLIGNFLAAFGASSLAFSEKEPSHIYSPNKGLPAGQELVYLLTHAMLHSIDLRMEKLTNGHFARYIDDMLFFGPDRQSLESWMDELKVSLSALGLQLNRAKTFIQPTTEPFAFLRREI